MKKIILFLLFLTFVWGCSRQPDYKNTALSPEQRAESLVKELTLEEKALLMIDASEPVERLGIKPYNWWNEALHGVARAGLATVFPQPIGMAASFDADGVYDVFNAVSDEARAKNAYYSSQGSYERYQGLTMWTPTINIYRDPRWGRGIETYGEDPYLTSRLGVMAVKGLQGPGDGKYDKLHACAKHFAVHSGPEWNRHTFDAKNISMRDLYETYLPAFEVLVKEGGVKEVMCAYNRYEGDPCCGSDRLLVQILRDDWGFDGIVVADCGAIADFYNDRGHHTHPDAAAASADAVISGTDLDCGSSYKALVESVQKGLISEEQLDVSVKRLLKARFELGEMDDNKDVSWADISFSVVASAKHDSLALDIALKSMTLLHNRNNFLPLKRGGQTIAVMGPNANDSVMQWGNYNGTPLRTVTILDGVRSAMGSDDKLIYEQGCAWVERTLIRSVFDQCSSANGAGFSARYWNNVKREGEPVTTTQITTPFRFCTSGATVFAPGVNLTDFSVTYNSVFTPLQSGEVVFELYSYGSGRIRIDGEEVKEFANRHGGRKTTHAMKVEAGQKYDIELEFEYVRSDALLNFDLGFKEDVDIKKSVDKVRDADIVIFAAGISPSLEGEEMGVDLPGFKRGDRTDIQLPDVQRELIDALYRAGKKIVLVNCSGSAIALGTEIQKCEALLQAWYPGQQGGTAVAEVLFGDYNPSGRLPITFYKDVSQLPDFEDYNMKGRTYRYMSEEPLYPFGYGLSYTTFEYGKAAVNKDRINIGQSLELTVPVTNKGKMDGNEVVQVYLRKQGDANGPLKTLRAFKRVFVPSGETVNVTINLNDKELEWWDETTGSVRMSAGTYDVMVGSSSRDNDLQVYPVVIL
ncbi:MAG: glycoside hydrolase family 3 C-terminal domain-containing protein [Tannerella sp.]|jgi:beta-glucosidase|nr:glycoside hydrolase family 3 C-terminal domain-containing protein [Tannerella sp.]